MAAAHVARGRCQRVPEPHRRVAASAGEAAPVGAKGDVEHGLRVACSGASKGRRRWGRRRGARGGPGMESVQRVTGRTRNMDSGWYLMVRMCSVEIPCARRRGSAVSGGEEAGRGARAGTHLGRHDPVQRVRHLMRVYVEGERAAVLVRKQLVHDELHLFWRGRERQLQLGPRVLVLRRNTNLGAWCRKIGPRSPRGAARPRVGGGADLHGPELRDDAGGPLPGLCASILLGTGPGLSLPLRGRRVVGHGARK